MSLRIFFAFSVVQFFANGFPITQIPNTTPGGGGVVSHVSMCGDAIVFHSSAGGGGAGKVVETQRLENMTLSQTTGS